MAYACEVIEIGEIAVNDFKSLKSENSKLQSVWDVISRKRDTLFCETGFQNLNNISMYPKIQVSMYPGLSASYCPYENVIKVNILTLLFSVSEESFQKFLPKISQNGIIINPFYRISGTFLHEFDHYLFFKERNLIGSDRGIIEEFKKNNFSKIEKRAYCKEMDFYKNYKNLNHPIYDISIGRVKHANSRYELKPSLIISNTSRFQIEEIIEDTKNRVNSLKNLKISEYNEKIKCEDIERFTEIGKLFSLKFDKNREKNEYETIDLDWRTQHLT